MIISEKSVIFPVRSINAAAFAAAVAHEPVVYPHLNFLFPTKTYLSSIDYKHREIAQIIGYFISFENFLVFETAVFNGISIV